jgi:tRNA(Ile)-lysidine synthase TilS/MesJ
MDRCDTCVLPRAGNLIEFEGDTCTLCASGVAEDSGQLSDVDMGSFIETVKQAGRGRSYDCVVGISGGRDSTYMLHQLVRRHGLRCIAGYYRTPYTPETTDENVVRVTKRLGVKLVRLHIDHEYHNKWARRAVLLWREQPTPVHANLTCAPCKAVNREILKLARRNRVRYLAMGSNRYEAVQIAVGVGADVPRTGRHAARLLDSMRLFRRGLESLARSRALWRFLPVGVKGVLYITQDTPFLRLLYPEVTTFDYFDLAGWDEDECNAVLSELGWELPPGCVSSWRADCTFAELKNRMFEQMTGTTYVDAFFSNRIRLGDMTREEALRRLEVEGRASDERLEQACEVLGVPAETLSLEAPSAPRRQ